MAIPTQVQSLERKRLEQLSQKPNTTVLTVEHDSTNEPWAASRLRSVMESITARVLDAPDKVSDFTLRKRLLEEEDVLAFQRQHPQCYWLLTDRNIMREKKSRDAVTGMLFIRDQIENGCVSEGPEADAMATRTVLEALK